MKKFVLLAVVIVMAGTSCQTLQQNLEARRNLAKCKYEFQNVVVRGIEMDGFKLRAVNLDIILLIIKD